MAPSSFADDPAPAPAAPAAPEGPKRAPLDAKVKAKLVALFTKYLDVADANGATNNRLQLMIELAGLRKAGLEPLADLDSLSAILYQARFYQPLFEKKILPKDAKEAEILLDTSTNIVSVIWDQVRCSLSMPPGYLDAAKSKKLPTMQPFPTIITLHELDDFQDAKGTKKFPGMEVIKRRYDRKVFKAITDSFLILAPVATRARFMEDDGRLNLGRVSIAASETWLRYDVDFQKLVIDGGADALALAASQTIMFAGVIVRGDAATLKTPELARNFAHLPVYVVGTAEGAAAKGLLAGGFPKDHLSVGSGDGLVEWLTKLPKRVIPKSFHWLVKDAGEQAQALWVNVGKIEQSPGAPTPNLDVECLDTKDDPNTVKIRAEGVRELSIFLSDALVDLDRDVRVVINGTPATEAHITTTSPIPKAVKFPVRLERTMDGTFDRDGFSVRRTMNLGFLYPALLQAIPVRSDVKADGTAGGPPADPATPTGGAAAPGGIAANDPAEKERAEREAVLYFTKAQEKEKAGELDKALVLYKKAFERGEATTVREQASVKIKELEAKAAAPKVVGPGVGAR